MKRIIIILFTTLFAACGNKTVQEQAVKTTASETTVQLTDAQLKNAGIATAKLEMKSIASVLRVSGRIDVPPQNLVSISAPLGGYLRSTGLLPGSFVSKGQALATLEDQQYIQLQQDYLTAKTRLSFAEKEYNRQKELNESKASSDKVFQQAQSEYNSQRILVRSLAEKLRLINISPERLRSEDITRYISLPSPISGYVSKVNVNIGKYVNPSDALFEIVDPTDIHLSLDVFEKDVNKLYIGQKVFAYTNANPDVKHPCTIILISKDISENKSYEVHCHFNDYDKTLLPGMFMNAEIEVQSKEAYTLPSDAIVGYEGKQFVFIQREKGIFEMIEVTTGNSENGFTELTPFNLDLLKDKAIVIKGAYSLLMKMKNTSDEE